MAMFHAQIDAFYQAGVPGGDAENLHATQYYLEEAKLLAAE